MPKRSKSYEEWQTEALSDPRAAASFLNAALEDSQEMFLLALRKIAQANEMTAVARQAGVKRETLYHALSVAGNPTLSTLNSVLDAMGMEISIHPKGRRTASLSRSGAVILAASTS